MKTAIIVLLAITALLAGTMVWADQKGRMGPEMRGGFGQGEKTEFMLFKVSRRLDLNDDQQNKLERFAEELGGMRKGRQNDKKGMHEELQGLLDEAPVDRAKALEIIDQRHQEFRRHMQQLVDAFADFSDSLDESQRSELKQIISERGKRHQGPPRWVH